MASHLALGDLSTDPLPDERAPAEDDAIEKILTLDLPFAQARQKLLEIFQRRYVERLVDQHDGNVTQAARASGLALRYFQLLRARHRDEGGGDEV